jgi:HK97 gp10 family phage protein
MSLTIRGEVASAGTFNRLVREFRRGVLGGGHAAVAIVVRQAQQGILNGSKSGRVYTTYFRTGRNSGVFPVGTRPAHRASAPGEYSANDTGALAASVVGTNTLFRMTVSANAPHAGFQEWGTSRMAPRPNLGNAVRDSEPRVFSILGDYVWRAIR